MIKVTPEIENKLMEYIKGLTGAKGVFVMLSEIEIPCPEESKNEPCDGHLSAGFTSGIDNAYMPALLETHAKYLQETIDSKKQSDAEVDEVIAGLKGKVPKNDKGEHTINLKDLL